MKMALSAKLVPRPRLVVSGINLGSNVGTNVLYSGTVSAATEAAILGVPSMAVSLDVFKNADYRASAKIARHLAVQVLKRGLPPGTLLNVNVPNLPMSRIKGTRVTSQGAYRFEDKFVKRMDPHGREYYWLTGTKRVFSKDLRFDDKALQQGYVSVTPVDYDMTAHRLVSELQDWKL